jgi:hypothetical protein
LLYVVQFGFFIASFLLLSNIRYVSDVHAVSDVSVVMCDVLLLCSFPLHPMGCPPVQILFSEEKPGT